MAAIEIFGFATSNNMKVRIALNYKDLQYVFKNVDPARREEIVAMTGQPLTPVLRHGETVLFDSGAIIRYLDANFPEAPHLFGGNRETLVAIEGWETFGRARLLDPLVRVVNQRLAGGDDPDVFGRAREDFQAAAAELRSALRDRRWLVGTTMTGADVTTAPVVYRAAGYGFCDRDLLGAALTDWMDRVMAHDRPDAGTDG